MAKLDAFLKIDEIPGESQDKDHPGEFDLINFGFSVTNSGSYQTGGGGGTGTSYLHDIPITTFVGKSSPELFVRSCSGKHFPKAVIVQRRAGDGGIDMLKWTLEDVFITGYHVNPGDGSGLPTESWSLNFKKITYGYNPQNADGTAAGFIEKGYDQATKEIT